MAFINYSRQYVFFAVARTGSTTCYSFLEELAKSYDDDYITFSTEEPELYHISPSTLLKELPSIKDFYKFAFVRNPKTRLISSWKEFRKEGHKDHFPEMQNLQNITQLCHLIQSGQFQKKIHFIPMSILLMDRNICCLDKILFFENLYHDLLATIKLFYPHHSAFPNLKHIRPTAPSRLTFNDNIAVDNCLRSVYINDLKFFYPNLKL